MSNFKDSNVCYKQEHLAHCFPGTIELVFESNIPATLWVHMEIDSFFQRGVISIVEETLLSKENHIC
jgi:hypothetical protein